jgi:hypothetical protein
MYLTFEDKKLKLNTARIFTLLSIVDSCILTTAVLRAETALPKSYVRVDIKVIIILRTKFPPNRLFNICFNVIQPSSRQRHYITPKRRNKRIILKYAEHPIRLSYRKSKILSEHLKISTSNFQFNVAAKKTNPMKYSSSREANSCSPSRETPRLIWNQKAQYRVYKGPSMTLSWNNLIQFTTLHTISWRRILIMFSHIHLQVCMIFRSDKNYLDSEILHN